MVMAPDPYETAVIDGVVFTREQLEALPKEAYLALREKQKAQAKLAEGSADPANPFWREEEQLKKRWEALPMRVSSETPVVLQQLEADETASVLSSSYGKRKDFGYEATFKIKLRGYGTDDAVEAQRAFLQRKLEAILHTDDVVVRIGSVVPEASSGIRFTTDGSTRRQPSEPRPEGVIMRCAHGKTPDDVCELCSAAFRRLPELRPDRCDTCGGSRPCDQHNSYD